MSDAGGAGPLLDRLSAARKAREDELAASRRAPVSAEQRMGAPFTPGDRVFDTVGGQEGAVERVTRTGPTAPWLVYLRLDGGGLLARRADQLLARPTRPESDR